MALLLANEQQVDQALLTELESTGRDPMEEFAEDAPGRRPRLATPSIGALIRVVRAGISVTDADRDDAIVAMRSTELVHPLVREHRTTQSEAWPTTSDRLTAVTQPRPSSLRPSDQARAGTRSCCA